MDKKEKENSTSFILNNNMSIILINNKIHQ